MEILLERKANRKELRLLQLAKTALSSVESILANTWWDRHDEYIAFNCKVSGYITVHDVKDILRKSKMTFGQIRKALIEFDEKRIYNVYYHLVEREADYFKDWVAGCSYTSKKALEENMDRYLVDFPYPAARPALKRLKSVEAKKRFIYRFFEDGFKALDKLAFIDDVFRIGRNGGHFAVAKASVFKEYSDRLRFFLKECFLDDSKILLDGNESFNHKTWLERVRGYYDCSEEDIRKIIQHCQAVRFVIYEGISVANNMNRAYFLENLREEIANEVGSFETLTDEEHLQNWIDHKVTLMSNASTYSYLRLSKDQRFVETSQAVRISVEESRKLYEKLVTLDPLKPHTLDEKISFFHATRFGKVPGYPEPVLIAGCHKIKWSFIQKFYQESLIELAA
jgi:hypothetical protein